MASLSSLQEGAEGDSLQKARLDQHANDVLVSVLQVIAEHFGDVQRLTCQLVRSYYETRCKGVVRLHSQLLPKLNGGTNLQGCARIRCPFRWC